MFVTHILIRRYAYVLITQNYKSPARFNMYLVNNWLNVKQFLFFQTFPAIISIIAQILI